jgi:choline dehydrogenase-like flavoprotein
MTVTTFVYEVDPNIEVTNKGAWASTYCYLPVSEAVAKEGFDRIANRVQALNTLSPHNAAILKNRFHPGIRLGQMEYIIDLGNFDPFFRPDTSDNKMYASMLQILQYPFSIGSVHISPPSKEEGSASSSDKPLVDPGYYSGSRGELDREIMTQCVKLTDKLFQSQPLLSIVRGRAYPPPSVETDEQMTKWVIDNTTTDWHPVGTCAMGGVGGMETGVVDERLKVYGVERLRVVDASVMPLQISAHLQSTVYVIGEKGAHMILEDQVSRRR